MISKSLTKDCQDDAFEKFRNNAYQIIEKVIIEVHHLSWDAMLNRAKVELERISDADRYLFFEKSIRDGFLLILRDLIKPIL